MADPILQNALARRDAALAEARRWDDFIHMYGELKSGQAQHAEGKSVLPTRLLSPAPAPTGTISDTEREAANVIRELQRPVSTRDLLTMLMQRGIEVGGKDPLSTLSARLSRAPTLANKRGEGWIMRDWADGNVPVTGAPSAQEFNQGDAPKAPHSGPVEPAAGGGTCGDR
jgi:hypothetical protein